MNPIDPSSAHTQNYTVPFVAMNKSVNTFDGINHQNTPEEHLHQIDAHIIFTMGEQPLSPAAYNQGHKQDLANMQCSLSGVALSWFLGLHKSYENDWSDFVSALKKNNFVHRKLYITHRLKIKLYQKMKLKTYAIML